MTTKNPPIETPELLLTRAALFEPDQPRKIGNKIVGNDKFKLEGFFDPASAEGRDFLKSLVQTAKSAGVEDPASVIRAAFPTLDELADAATRKRARNDGEEAAHAKRLAALDKITERLSGGARRLRASTAYGPVSTALANGRDAMAKDVFPGVVVIASVTPNVFQAEFKNGEDMLSLWLGPVLIVRTGERLFGGSPQAKSVFAARLSGGKSNVNLDDDVPF
jgi:hypothetical protein